MGRKDPLQWSVYVHLDGKDVDFFTLPIEKQREIYCKNEIRGIKNRARAMGYEVEVTPILKDGTRLHYEV